MVHRGAPGTTLPVGSLQNVSETVEVKEHEGIGKRFTFGTTIGTPPIDLTSTVVKCIDCTIQNKEVTSKTGVIAYGEARILFENVTVDLPATTYTVNAETGLGK